MTRQDRQYRMHDNTRKERFSLAYVEAVASLAGFHIAEPRVDFDSVDGVLIADFGRRPRIEFQAKATSQELMRENHLSFQLSCKNYNDLRAENLIIPRLLIVLLMPRDDTRWLSQTKDELCLRHCAYWVSLQGQPPRPDSRTVTVQIPVGNIFSSEELSDLMKKAERGESL